MRKKVKPGSKESEKRESDFHFLTECSLYDDENDDLFGKIKIINNNIVLLRW